MNWNNVLGTINYVASQYNALLFDKSIQQLDLHQ